MTNDTKQNIGNKRRRSWGSIVTIVSLIGLVAIIAAFLWSSYCWSGASSVTISPETTVLLEPLTPDGKCVDYVRAFCQMQEDELGEPSENGFRDLVVAFGPRVLDSFCFRNACVDGVFVDWDEYLHSSNQSVQKWMEHEWKYVCECLNIDPNVPPTFWTRNQYSEFLNTEGVDKNEQLGLNKPIDLEIFDRAPQTPEEIKLAGRWLQRNQDILKIFEDAINKENFQCCRLPESYYGINVDVQCYNFFLMMATQFRLRAWYHVATKDYEGALADQNLILRLGVQSMKAKANSLVEKKIAAEIVLMGTEIATLLVRSGEMSSELLVRQRSILTEILRNLDFQAIIDHSIENDRLYNAIPCAVSLANTTPSRRVEGFVFLDSLGTDKDRVLDERVATLCTHAFDGDAFLRQVNLYLNEYGKEGFSYLESPFVYDAKTIWSINVKERSRAWGNVFACFNTRIAQRVTTFESLRQELSCLRCWFNLMRIQNAILLYYIDNGTLPPAFSVDGDGRRLHSWRVLILPYLGEEYKDLYSRIRLNEPWNSEFNCQFSSLIPDVFHCPLNKTEETNYFVILGENRFFDESGVGKDLGSIIENQGEDVLRQIMVVEKESPCCWMCPNDEIHEGTIAIEGSSSDSLLENLGTVHYDHVAFVRTDGSVGYSEVMTAPAVDKTELW